MSSESILISTNSMGECTKELLKLSAKICFQTFFGSKVLIKFEKKENNYASYHMHTQKA